ncbi:polyketide synthase [Arachnomyces sp. PD_36]|nr:polyketide synthase [Arachnomyces sp. PD_36]
MATKSFTPIAICGYSCKLPGDATDAEGLWRMCEEGRSAWSGIPQDRFSQKAFYNASRDEPGTTTVAGGHFLAEDVYAFDASFFNMSVETAMSMDPAVRLQLESVFEAFEHTGMTLDDIAGSRSSVFSASFHRDYHDSLSRNPDELPRYLLTGTGTAMLSNRISHFFDLRGPSMTLDTGCSSSLTSLHTACRSLQAGDCDASIVTGCNLMLNPDPFISMSGVGLLSPSGRSYAFDSRAEGYGRGEGVATLVLKTLAQATADGDTVHAVIRGSASNQDGKTTTITSPSQQAQEILIKDCYKTAGLDPCQTPFVECHGTGTQVGDVCEVSAIRTSFRTDFRHETPLYLGSVKSNIGHLEAASGLASIIKMIKAFEHNKIPPNHGLESPNPSIPWADWKVTVPRDGLPWPSEFPRRASVNSFGYGGANAHIIMDAPDSPMVYLNGDVKPNTGQTGKLFIVSSNDEQSCGLAMSNLRTYVDSYSFSNSDEEAKLLDSLAYKLARKRTHFKWRTAVQASSAVELAAALSSGESKPVRSSSKPSIGFVFTGQGAHWAGMGKELIGTYPVFHEALKKLDGSLSDLGASWSIIAKDELERDSSASRLHLAEFSMPICCALQIALVLLLRSWNIVPSAVTGHSSGESAAAFAAGALDMRSALAVQYYRGLLTTASNSTTGVKGAMLAVGLGPEGAQKYIDNIASGRVVIGCFNSPSSVTLSGDEEGILELEQAMRERGVFARKLQVQSAFHSHHMECDEPKYRQLLESSLRTTYGQLPIPVASSVTGTWLTQGEDFGPGHWVKYMLQPVRFAEASKRLLTENGMDQNGHPVHRAVDVVVEVGPHSALASPLRQTMQSLKITDIAYTSALKRSENALTSAHSLAGFLWCCGCPMNFNTITHRPREDDTPIIDPPSYSWNHTARFEIRDTCEQSFRHRKHSKSPLIGAIQPLSNPSAPSWQRKCSIDARSWPYELSVDSVNVSPQPFMLSMAVEAAEQLVEGITSVTQKQSGAICLENIRFNSVVELPSGVATVALRTSLYELQQPTEKTAEYARAFQVHCIDGSNQWTLLCQGQVTVLMDRVGPSFHSMQVATPDNYKVALRPGICHSKPGGNDDLDDKISQTSSVQLEISPQFTGLCFEGKWVDDDSKAALDGARLGPQRLASAFRAGGGLDDIHPAGVAKRIPASVERVLIGCSNTDTSSPLYTATARIDRDGTVSVAWRQLSKSNGALTNLIQGVDIRGLRFQVPSVISKALTAAYQKTTNGIHISSLRHSLVNVSNEAMDEIPRHTLSDTERGILLDLNRLCSLYFYETLAALRKDPPRRLLGHFSSYVQLMKSMEAETSSEWLQLSDEDRVELKARVMSSSVNGLLVCTVGDELVPLIRGEVDPLEVMMKDRLLHRYYEEGLRWTRSYLQLQALLASMSSEHPRMEILEIGAGTGGATTSVLQSLEMGENSPADIGCESYTYTDISAGFFSKAKEKFSRYEHVMDFRKLDIEKDLKSQSFEGRTYDLIVASQCLHATSNMRHTMANVRKLLKPNGRLVMVETTKDSLDIQLFASCFRGWWLSEEPERKWSPSLPADMWQRILVETGFSGIDFTVRDCEDEELYAMQVILSTAVPPGERATDQDGKLHVIASKEFQHPTITHSLQGFLGMPCEMGAIENEEFGRQVNDSSYMMAIGHSWEPSEIQKLANDIEKYRGALLVSVERPGQATLEDADDKIGDLRASHPQKSIVSLRLGSEVRVEDESTLLAVSNVFKSSVYGNSTGRRDREYFLTPRQLYAPRVTPFSPALDCKDESGILKPHGHYVIRGISTSLIAAACKLIASLGARNILVVLIVQDGDDGSGLLSLQNFAQTLVNAECQVTSAASGEEEPKLSGKIAGIIDFGDVKEDINLRNVSERSNQSQGCAWSRNGAVDTADFHINFAPLYDLTAASSTPGFAGTKVYTGSIATTDEFAREVRSTGSQPVEMHTILFLLADIVAHPGIETSETLYIGFPTSFSPEERDQVCGDPQFRSLSLRELERRRNDKDSSESNVAEDRTSSLQILPTMSKEEKADIISKGIVGYIADMFMLSVSEVDEKSALKQYIDSLTAVMCQPEPQEFTAKRLEVMRCDAMTQGLSCPILQTAYWLCALIAYYISAYSTLCVWALQFVFFEIHAFPVASADMVNNMKAASAPPSSIAWTGGLAFGTGTVWFKPSSMNEFDDYLADSIEGILRLGCYHIDTADDYNTENEIGHAIKASQIERERIYITSKVAGECQVRTSIRRSLGRLKVDYLDLCLIHVPFFASNEADLQRVWLEMEEAQREGLVRSLGVSNFLPHHLDAILKVAKVKPVVNQIEFHPLFMQKEVREHNQKHGIVTQGYGIFTPLVKSMPQALVSYLEELGGKYKVDSSAILLRWSIQQQVAPVTTTGSEERLSEYLQFASFYLEEAEVDTIIKLGSSYPFRRYLNAEIENMRF